jgi:hypothetical protein
VHFVIHARVIAALINFIAEALFSDPVYFLSNRSAKIDNALPISCINMNMNVNMNMNMNMNVNTFASINIH